MKPQRRNLIVGFVLLAAMAVGGCASSPSDDDPFEPMNRRLHAFNDVLDENVLKPLADGYVAITTAWMREGVTNFFNNAGYPNVILNDFLQGKIEQGFEDTMRLVFNTTFGLLGVVDFASDAGLPAHAEDLGQTLAVWGVGELAFLELPLLGPSSVRDVTDQPVLSMVSLTNFIGSNAILWPLTALNVVNSRANLSSLISLRDRSALDPYVFTREAYRQRRRFLIYDGEPPDELFDKLEQSSGVEFEGLVPRRGGGDAAPDLRVALLRKAI